jgi:type II secretory pathway component GspD/PulD (secretin)
MIKYDNSSTISTMIVTKTPTVSFDQRVPTHFINEFLRRMGKGQITVKDYQGNELEVYYNRDTL